MTDAKLDLLVVAAHPDDAELALGGLLLAAADAGLRTGVLDLTAGERGTRGSRERRATAAAAAAEAQGLAWRGCLERGDARLADDATNRELLALELARLRPTTVVTHAPSTLAHRLPADRHPDHRAAGDLCRAACFLSGLTRVTNAPAHRPRRLLYFPSHELAEPDLIVDVSSVWERKLAVLRCYASQLDPAASPEDAPNPRGPHGHLPGGSDIVERVERRSRLWGERIDARHGEPLLVDRALGLDTGALAAILK